MVKKTVKFSIVALMLTLLILPITRDVEYKDWQLPGSAHALSAASNPVGTNMIVKIAQNQNPAVVSVSIKRKIKNVQRQLPFPGKRFQPFPDGSRDPFNRGPQGPNHLVPGGMGTGFVIDPEGHVLTNYHVIADAQEIQVKFQNDKEYDAVLVGADPKTDIALIKIVRENGAADSFPHVTLGDSDELNVGEWVVAVGNAFGLSHTVTTGIVSAKGRNIGSGPYDEYIQTDASINPGNSGGPLINMEGKVVGINTAIISGNVGGNVGIGFAVPINLAKSILKELKENGEVSRGWLGVTIQKLTPELAQTFNLQEPKGALVNDVMPHSPASKGGMQRGDVIVKFGDHQIDKFDVLPREVAKISPGDTVSIEVIRDGKRKILEITISRQIKPEDKLAFLDEGRNLSPSNHFNKLVPWSHG